MVIIRTSAGSTKRQTARQPHFFSTEFFSLLGFILIAFLLLGCNKAATVNKSDTTPVADLLSPFVEGKIVKTPDNILFTEPDSSLTGTPIIFSTHNPSQDSFFYIDQKLDADSDLWEKYQDFTLTGGEPDSTGQRGRAQPGANLFQFLEAADLFQDTITAYDSVGMIYNKTTKSHSQGKLSVKIASNGLTYIFNQHALFYEIIPNADIRNQVGNFGTSDGHRAISNVYSLSMYNDQFVDKNGDKLIIMTSFGWTTPKNVFSKDHGFTYQTNAIYDEFSGSITVDADPAYTGNKGTITALPVYTSSSGYFENPTYFLSPRFSIFVEYLGGGLGTSADPFTTDSYPSVKELLFYSNIANDNAPAGSIPFKSLRLERNTHFTQSNPTVATDGFPLILKIIPDSVSSDLSVIYKDGLFAGRFYGPWFDSMGGVFKLQAEIDGQDHFFWGVLAQLSYGNRSYNPADYAPDQP